MRIIYINQKEKGEQKRYRILVDDEDYHWLNDLRGWWVNPEGYVLLRKHLPTYGKMVISMPRLIMLYGLGDPKQVVRHADHDQLNMQKSNLYIVRNAP